MIAQCMEILEWLLNAPHKVFLAAMWGSVISVTMLLPPISAGSILVLFVSPGLIMGKNWTCRTPLPTSLLRRMQAIRQRWWSWPACAIIHWGGGWYTWTTEELRMSQETYITALVKVWNLDTSCHVQAAKVLSISDTPLWVFKFSA